MDLNAAQQAFEANYQQDPRDGLTVTASFGVAALRGEPDSPGALFARADARLYEAKAAGRNTVR